MAVTRFKIAQLANGTDGELITWDASGVPTTVAVGTAGHVLTSNGIGTAPTFQAVSGGGSSSGISGAVQFSGGSGTFSSDATNFFFNDSTNRLELAGGTSTNLLISGLNGGITVTPASSITGFYNVLNSQFSATGNINLNLYNTNTTDSTANARIALTTSTGGGDPFLLINTAEAGYILGVDNSGGDKFYIGTGTTPSSMTVSNIIIDGTKMGVQQATPTAKLHLAAGSSTSNTAPLKIDTGTALATPEDGAMEYHSSHLYFTIGSTRYQLDQQAAGLVVGSTAISSGTNTRVLYNNSGVLGEYTISGTGNVAMTTSPSFTTPSLGAATATKITVAGQYASTRFGLTDGATIALDWNNGNVQSVVLGGNRTFTFANPLDGGRYLIKLKQDGTGSRTVTWPTVKWKGGTAPTLTTTANKYDWITLIYDSVDGYSGDISANF